MKQINYVKNVLSNRGRLKNKLILGAFFIASKREKFIWRMNYFHSLHQQICKIGDDQERRIRFYEVKIELETMPLLQQLPDNWQQDLKALEFSGYVDFYNKLLDQHKLAPVTLSATSECILS